MCFIDVCAVVGIHVSSLQCAESVLASENNYVKSKKNLLKMPTVLSR